jgi:ATP-dependent DNA helicase PIF1
MEHQHLSAEQGRAVSAALEGRSIWLTGGAGTGKSATLMAIIAGLQQRFGGMPGAVAVVAPTGVAALNVGGTTINSWAKLKLLDKEKAATLEKGDPRPLRQAQVIVIDEISMVADWLLEVMDRLGRQYCDEDQPFGGIQMLCGDFLQLAPVKGDYCFQSPAWRALSPQRFELAYAFRQGTDVVFARMLGEIRVGNLTAGTLAALRAGRAQDDMKPTLLYAINKSVDRKTPRTWGSCRVCASRTRRWTAVRKRR